MRVARGSRLPRRAHMLDALARLQCPAMLGEILAADEQLRTVDVVALRQHWKDHCADNELENAEHPPSSHRLSATAVALAAPIVVAAPAVTQAAQEVVTLGAGLFT